MTNAVTSLGAVGSAVATSVAGTNIATIAAGNLGKAGPYEFYIQLTAVAAGAAADVNNVVLVLGASSIVVPFTPAAGVQAPIRLRGILDGATAANLNVGSATSTIAYYAVIYADYLGAVGSNLLHR